MPIHAVVAGVELSAREPLPERWGARVERCVPTLGPRQGIRILVEALGEAMLGEPVHDRTIRAVGRGAVPQQQQRQADDKNQIEGRGRGEVVQQVDNGQAARQHFIGHETHGFLRGRRVFRIARGFG